MDILVTGADGQLGHWIRNVSSRSGDRYVFTDVRRSADGKVDMLDITDAQAVSDAVGSLRPGVIVNCAAYTDVDKAEDEPEKADLLNRMAVGNLAAAARDSGAVLIHVSTDYVFGKGSCNVPLREDSAGTPACVYGYTKLLGEEAVKASGCRYVIMRTSWLYSEYGRNFLKTMLSLTASEPEVKVVFDQVGTPTYAADLAGAVHAMIESRGYEGKYGIYHYSDEGVCSWFDFAVTIARYAGHSTCRIVPCRSSEFPSKAVRPSYSVLDKGRFKAAFGMDVPYWTDSLARCMRNMGCMD